MNAKRRAYLEELAQEYGINEENVFALADLFGEIEDHDGLISALKDIRN